MFRCLLLLAAPLAIAVWGSAAEDVVRFDFETGDLQHWTVVEGKFDRLVSDRDVFHNTYPERPDRKYNKQGKYYLSTVEQQPGMPSNDRMTGMVDRDRLDRDRPRIATSRRTGYAVG